MSGKGLLGCVSRFLSHDPSRFLPLTIADCVVGEIRKDHAERFADSGGFKRRGEGVFFEGFQGSAQLQKTLDEACTELWQTYGFKPTGEKYPILQKWGEKHFGLVDRVVIPWLGVRGFGVHVNGYVRKADGSIHVWIGKRAMDRRVDPGKLDNMIGGGLPYGLSIRENLCKEAWEEAGLDEKAVASALHASTLHYKVDMMKGVRNDTLFVFDLEMPEGLAPCNTDGEVETFSLMPAQEVLSIVRDTDAFKFNCDLVLVDFFLRHGMISPSEADYAQLVSAMSSIRTQEGKEG